MTLSIGLLSINDQVNRDQVDGKRLVVSPRSLQMSKTKASDKFVNATKTVIYPQTMIMSSRGVMKLRRSTTGTPFQSVIFKSMSTGQQNFFNGRSTPDRHVNLQS